MAKRPWKPGGELPVVGDVLRVKSHHPGVPFDRYEVRGVVDDQWVLRTWNRRKQWWQYSCHDRYSFTHGIFSVEWEKERV